MTEPEFKALKPGDKIRRTNADPAHIYTVLENGPVLGVVKVRRDAVAHSAAEWNLVEKSKV